MKLLTKTTLYFLSAMIILLVLTGTYLFNRLSKGLNERNDKELIADELGWIRYLEKETENGTTVILTTADLSIYPSNAPADTYPAITDVGNVTSQSGNHIPVRQLSQVVSIGGISYQLIIRRSLEQRAALVTDFTKIMFIVFAGLFIATIIFSWAISRRLWAPFKRSLQRIRNIELQKIEAIHFEKTNTKEFNELNASLNYMTNKIYQDFSNMKEFIEDAAHEMQTPLAAAKSKLEILLQDTSLKEEQLNLVVQASNTLSRLAKLNQGLLLLAKIENEQYKPTVEVSLATVTKKYLLLFNELISDKKIKVETNLEEDCSIQIHPFLADSLIINLLGNAVKYNIIGGTVKITTSISSYEVGNTALPGSIKPERLFKRFNTSRENEETSNGLGLAIVKKITDTNKLTINYHEKNGINYFTINKVVV